MMVFLDLMVIDTMNRVAVERKSFVDVNKIETVSDLNDAESAEWKSKAVVSMSSGDRLRITISAGELMERLQQVQRQIALAQSPMRQRM